MKIAKKIKIIVRKESGGGLPYQDETKSRRMVLLLISYTFLMARRLFVSVLKTY